MIRRKRKIPIYKKPLFWIMGIVGLYFLFFQGRRVQEPTVATNTTTPTTTASGQPNTSGSRRTTSEPTSNSLTTDTVDPVILTRKPPPGYSGPLNGPYTWAGIGPPPNGQYTSIGEPIYM